MKVQKCVKMDPETMAKIEVKVLETRKTFSCIANQILGEHLGVAEPEKRKTKRPRQRTLSLSPEVFDAITVTAGQRKCSMTDLINEILAEGLR